MGLLTAVLFAAQVVLAVFPNINLVTVLVMAYTIVYGRRVFGVIYAFALLEGLTYGFGIWWVNYLYVWSILALIVLALRRSRSTLVWAAVGGGFGLSFGMLCAIPYFIAGGWAAGISYWVAGIPFDITHCISNVVLSLVLFRPLLQLLERLEKGRLPLGQQSKTDKKGA